MPKKTLIKVFAVLAVLAIGFASFFVGLLQVMDAFVKLFVCNQN